MNNISVCIPVYNHFIDRLITDLLNAFKECSIKYEIIIIDDASNMKYKQKNREHTSRTNVFYKELPYNIGRSSIRNRFLKYAKYDNLLFLDCDSIIPNNAFIANYLSAMENDYQVICGGRKYGKKPTDKKYMLRWQYGVKRECKSVEQRNKLIYKSFISNNFIVKKSVLENIKFDERLRDYGHEDSLFAYKLMINNVDLSHIYNPSIHNYNETSTDFIVKTEQGINNLIFINKYIIENNDFQRINKLLRTYYSIKKVKLTKIIYIMGILFKPVLKWLLKNGITSLRIFDLYKLSYLTKII